MRAIQKSIGFVPFAFFTKVIFKSYHLFLQLFEFCLPDFPVYRGFAYSFACGCSVVVHRTGYGKKAHDLYFPSPDLFRASISALC